MKKVLFIVPHLSTGGLPQYTLSLIKKIINDVDVYCIEYELISYDFIVQRNQIVELLGNNFYSLGRTKNLLNKIVNDIKPDIIHLQEMPEYFMHKEIADELYSNDRSYTLVETSHDSSFNYLKKKYFPDYLALISEYQRKEFSKLNIPIKLVEADIEYKQRQDRKLGLKKLGLDPNLKHVLNVGLFTPRKNQAEIFDYAREFIHHPIQFHFIGNQAGNFKEYWEPLLKNIPSNVKIWGERSDVDTFYSCMDLFLFTSRGTSNNKETSPLVIREAIGYDMPLLIYNLPVYLGMYDKYKNVHYLEYDDFVKNINSIAKFSGLTFDSNLYEKISSDKDEIIKKLKEEESDILTKLVQIRKKISELSGDGNLKVRFNSEDNKIYYSYKYKIDDAIISVRDIDSNVVIWSVKYDVLDSEQEYWIIPIPKNHYDFENNSDFGGFKIEIYSDKKFLESKDIRIKKPNIDKHIVKIDNMTEPTFFNYNEFFIEKIYDPYLANKSFNTVVDVGANVGMWIEYIKSVSNVNKIYAIEPNTVAIDILKKSFDDITLIESALHTTDEKIVFYTDEKNSTISSIDNHSNFSNKYEVQGITLKTLLRNNNISEIDLMKIDIESAEYDLVSSFDENDFSKINNMLIEYHFLGDRTIDDVFELIDVLQSNGYKTTLKNISSVGGFIFASKGK